jgi:8-oxo-dGTP pyrophosphatase MutT (NUDIX family)
VIRQLPEIESDFRLPPLDVSEASLCAHFSDRGEGYGAPLRNFHHEPAVPNEIRERAVPSAVLIAFVARESGLGLLLTRRHESISLPGQVCFPGGRSDPGDADRTATALREAQEEIGLAPAAVRVLGSLGRYVSHTGYDIEAVVGLVRPPLALRPHPREVAEILELPARVAFRSDAYRLRRRPGRSDAAVFSLEHAGAVVTGPTVCLLMNLYARLLESHAR